ncbi:MAG: CHRD domain-containing protein, partial [Planctomycetota bacterium]
MAISLANSAALAGGVEHRIAVITGAQEVPGVVSNALGCGTFRIDTAANTVDYYIVFSGLTAAETAAHIHGYADPGAGAGVVHPLPLGSPKIGTWTYAEADESNILAGKAYVNIHSAAFPAGEIRGQIVTHYATIDGAQEAPPNASPAQGWAVFNIDTNANTLGYHIVHNAAGETAAHIHGFAAHGANSGVVHPLPLGSPKIGVWNYPEADEPAILDGMTYVNIHTGAFPAGEIRGQVVRTVSPIDAMQEVPPNGST